MKIALIGAGCTGKTTVFEKLKQEYDGEDDIAFCEEVARSFFRNNPTAVNRRTSFNIQTQLMEEIIAQEKKLMASFAGTLICDRAVICAPAYVRSGGDLMNSNRLINRIHDWLRTYDRLFLFDPEGITFTGDDIRKEDEAERQRTHQAYVSLMDENFVPYRLVGGSIEERTAQVKAVL